MTDNKALFMKWIQNLFYVQCAALAASLISQLPFIETWFSWVTRVITIATIVILFKLIPLNERYRKAVILMVISMVAAIFSSYFLLLVLIASICSIVATYQEYIGHSEVIAEADEKLSRNWRSLFNWELWGGLGFSFVVSIVTVAIGVANAPNTEVSVTVMTTATTIFGLVLQVVYIMLLKRMLTAYANYEPQPKTEAVEEV